MPTKSFRQFDNPLDLTANRAWDRLYPLDNLVEVRREDSSLLSIFSTLSSPTIETTITNVVQSEPVADRYAAAVSFLSSSGLAGRNISTVNNNTDRDAMLKVIGFLLGIIDLNGLILGTPAPIVPQNKVIKNS